MISYTFSADGFEKTDKLQKYVERKVRDIEKYIPRRARESAEMTVRIVRNTKSKTEAYECSVSIVLPEEKLMATEKVEHSYAALDVAMAELRRQIREYKTKHGKQRQQRKSVAFWRRQRDQAPTDSEI